MVWLIFAAPVVILLIIAVLIDRRAKKEGRPLANPTSTWQTFHGGDSGDRGLGSENDNTDDGNNS